MGSKRATRLPQDPRREIWNTQSPWAEDSCARWPADYAERRLFCGIPKIVLTSATIRPKTLELLAIDNGHVDFHEYPSSFPVDRRPVYFVPSVRKDKRATPEHLRAWISKIDAIVRPRLQTKGIIHTVCIAPGTKVLNHTDLTAD
jgi:Rad3-related DNA helicase